MKLEVANFDVLCPMSQRIQQIEISLEELERRTTALGPGLIVLEQEYLRNSSVHECICFINKIDDVITESYRNRLKKSLETLKTWKENQTKKYEEEIRRMNEEIRKAEELLNG